ncbi:alpha/beta fold hydrolase [Streptomyces sp. M10(2022)]
MGERVHLASPQVGLTTHIADVVNCVRYEDLDEIVLLGFSYGGCVVTGALEYIADRVRHLVYLDAFVLDDGEAAGLPAGRAARVCPISAAPGWCRRRFASSTTPWPERGSPHGARRSPSAPSPSRYG